jgi:hypothetical protein
VNDQLLDGGYLNAVVRIGDTVHRPTARWSPAVHALLRHFEEAGFDGAPREGLPVALIDWDLATPGGRAAHVAALASWWAPLRPDEEAARYGLPTDRHGKRLRAICDAYGLGERADVVARALAQRRCGYELHRELGSEQRQPGWGEMWDAGSGETILAGVRWLEENQAELERWL